MLLDQLSEVVFDPRAAISCGRVATDTAANSPPQKIPGKDPHESSAEFAVQVVANGCPQALLRHGAGHEPVEECREVQDAELLQWRWTAVEVPPPCVPGIGQPPEAPPLLAEHFDRYRQARLIATVDPRPFPRYAGKELGDPADVLLPHRSQWATGRHEQDTAIVIR